MKELKTSWAPLLTFVRLFFGGENWYAGGVRNNLLGLGEGHPEDKDELEDVVEGYNRQSVVSLR